MPPRKVAQRREGSLPTWLAQCTDDFLATLLAERPDVASPAPSTIDVLAARLQLPQATCRAAEELDLPTLTVLVAAERAGAARGPVAESAIAAQIPYLTAVRRPSAAKARVHEAVVRLRRRGLLWGPDEALQLPTSIAEARTTAQVVLPRAGEATGKDLETALSAAGDIADAALRRIAGGSVPRGQLPAAPEKVPEKVPDNTTDDAVGNTGDTKDTGDTAAPATLRTALESLAAAGVLSLDDDGLVTLHATALRRIRYGTPGKDVLETPHWPGPPVDPKRRDGAAGVAAIELDYQVRLLLDVLDTAPAAQLRDGGVGIREVRRLAAESGLDAQLVVIVLEVLAAAELIAAGDTRIADDELYDVWAPTPASVAWREAELAQRVTVLAVAWWQMPRVPWRLDVGPRTPRDPARPRPAGSIEVLVPDNLRFAARGERSAALAALAQLPPEQDTTEEDFTELLRWSRPRLVAARLTGLLTDYLDQARMLGAVSGWGLSAVGRALLEADAAAEDAGTTADRDRADRVAMAERLEQAFRQVLPEPVDELIVQGDHTILAPGPLVAELAREVELFAEVETPGAATTYRLTEDSLRRAFDAGRTADGICELLEQTSITPVPQGVSYLVADAARRHGALRIGGASSFVRSEDTALIAELAAGPLAAELGLRRIAPTVLICADRPRTLLATLRKAGYAPIAEDSDSQIVDISRDLARVDPTATPGPRYAQPGGPQRMRLSRAAAEAAVAQMRSAEQAGHATAAGRRTGEAAIALLHEAVQLRQPVAIAVVDAAGRTASGMLLPIQVSAGRVAGVDPHTGTHREYLLHRIISVALQQ